MRFEGFDRWRGRCASIAMAMILATGAGPGWTEGLRVDRQRVSFAADGEPIKFELNNDDATDVIVQIRAFRSHMVGGQEVLEPTIELIPSPPVIRIPPKSFQVIRLMSRGSAEAAPRDYRVLVQQVSKDSSIKFPPLAVLVTVPAGQ